MIKIKVLALLLFTGCLSANAQFISKKESAVIDKMLVGLSSANKPGNYLFRNVNVLTMNDSVILRNQDVLVGSGIIQKIAPGIEATDAIVIDGKGKYLVPGLTDTHVHLFDKHAMKNTWMLMLLVNGVTSVRDMCGEPGKILLREKIRTNNILGPNLYQSGPVIDGTKENLGLFAFAATPEEGRQVVRQQKKAGYDFIKLYDGLSKQTYEAIVKEAHSQGMLVFGHLPDQVTLDEAIKLNQNSIEHLTGYIEWQGYQVKLTAGDNYGPRSANSVTWNCPTIYLHFMNGSRAGAKEMMTYADSSGLLPTGISEHWRKIVNSNSKAIVEIADKYGPVNFETISGIVRDLHKSGAKLIAGTDAGSLPLMIPGYSLHQELRIMNELGIPIFETLKMATVNAAQSMNKTSEFGTVEVGKRADMLLLNSNPLSNVANLQDKAGIMIRGIWLPKEKIEGITNDMRLVFKK